MDYRIEKDSLGEVRVPAGALYLAQTQRAVENFPISGYRFGRRFLEALGWIKRIAAETNCELKLLDEDKAKIIQEACREVIEGKWDDHFPLDIFQTGSGTSTNMNANEVIASRATQLGGGPDTKVHPNDHVNYGQSSNDVIPTAIRISACLAIRNDLIPALNNLQTAFAGKAKEYGHIAKTGRTHLMDAMPVTFAQVFNGYRRQLQLGVERMESTLKRLSELPLGGTAVGTGINTHPEFAARFSKSLSRSLNMEFTEAKDHFEAQSTVDAPVELSGALKTLAVSLLKIANDLRWMNSGPNAGLGEIQLAALQPGSSIMPGKVNPVIEESTAMVCAQVIGNDAAITLAGASGNFELNVMLPLVAHNLLESIRLLTNAAQNFATRSVNQIVVREDRIRELIDKNPILVTALNPLIGYDLAAKIAKKAYVENRSLKEVALEMTPLSKSQLEEALDPIKMTKGGIEG